jgi:hypothetical protein
MPCWLEDSDVWRKPCVARPQRTLGCVQMESRSQPFAQRRNLWTLKVNLPIDRHQHLHRFQLTASGG